jgi:hypothetical protein
MKEHFIYRGAVLFMQAASLLSRRRFLFILINILFMFQSIFSEELTKEVGVYYFYDRTQTHPGTGDPNWFHYWSQVVPHTQANALIYDDRLRTLGDAYGGTNPFTRTIGVSSLASEYNNETGHRGLHTFHEVVAHELQHLALWDGWWPNGYEPAHDIDRDGYPDAWEVANSTQKNEKFQVGKDDSYGGTKDLQENGLTAGTNYEERVCRAREITINEALYDAYDWSYDPTNVNQGKMWLSIP